MLQTMMIDDNDDDAGNSVDNNEKVEIEESAEMRCIIPLNFSTPS